VNPPGACLAEARIAHGLSIESVAQQLKFAPRQIEALEADRYDALPGVTVVRGMVRGYARLVQLDAGPLLDALRDSVPTPDANRIIARYQEQVPFSDRAKRSNVVYVVFTVAVLAVAALVLVQWRQERSAPARMSFVPAAKAPLEPAQTALASVGASASAAVPAASEAGATAAPDAASAASRSPPEAAAEADAAPTAPAGDAQAEPAAEAKDAAPVAPAGDALAGAADRQTQMAAAAGPAEAATGSADATAPGVHRAELEFLGESWVEIRDADGKVLHSQLNARGSTVRIEGKAPLSFVIGNAQYARLRYDGRSVDLAPYIRVSVARFTLR
jgi:cytoskeleton protein RodZ